MIEKEKGLLEVEKGMRERDKYLNKNNENKQDNVNQSNHENFKNMLEKLKRNMADIENMSKISESEVATTLSKNSDIDYIKFKNSLMTPFKEIDRNITWYRISPYELTALSKDAWKYSNNQFVFACYKKYNHLMLGIDREKDEEAYILGVPCKYDKDFVAKGELKGFEKFTPVDSDISISSLKGGEYGYRTIYIN